MSTIYWIHNGNSCSESGDTPINKNQDDENNQNKNVTPLLNSNQSYHPFLTYLGISQSIMLGCNAFTYGNYTHCLSNKKDLISIDTIDTIYCSPSLRSVMTAMFSLRTINYKKQKANKSPIVITICPFISENTNYKLKNIDKQNDIVETTQLKEMIQFTNTFIKEDYRKYHNDYEIYEIINKIKNNNIIKNIEDKEILNLCNNYVCKYINTTNDIYNNNVILNIINNLNKIIIRRLEFKNDNTLVNELSVLVEELNKFSDEKFYVMAYNYKIKYWDNTNNTIESKFDDNDFNSFLNTKINNINKFNNKSKEVLYESLNNKKKMNFLNTRDDLKLFYDFLFYKKFTNKNILCFSHNTKIKTHFNRFNGIEIKDYYYSSDKQIVSNENKKYINNINNTEIIKSVFSINNGNQTSKFINVLNDYKNNSLNIKSSCKKICGVMGYIYNSDNEVMKKINDILNKKTFDNNNENSNYTDSEETDSEKDDERIYHENQMKDFIKDSLLEKEQLWKDKLKQLQIYIIKHSKIPLLKIENKEKDELANWLSKQQIDYLLKNDIMKYENIRK